VLAKQKAISTGGDALPTLLFHQLATARLAQCGIVSWQGLGCWMLTNGAYIIQVLFDLK